MQKYRARVRHNSRPHWATGIQRHLQVMRGVTHHQRALWRHTKFLHQLLQHQGVRLARRSHRPCANVKNALPVPPPARLRPARAGSLPVATVSTWLRAFRSASMRQHTVKQADIVLVRM
jgi:hypothetical protein